MKIYQEFQLGEVFVVVFVRENVAKTVFNIYFLSMKM